MSGVEKRDARIMSEQVLDKFVTKTADASLNIREQQVWVDSSDNTVAIALPNVSEAAGKIFSIEVTVYSSAVTITAAESYGFEYTQPTAAGDGCLFYSDGYGWWEIATRT